MWINVKDSPYLAMGDGKTDDTDAIQAALTAATSSSSTVRNAVYFPRGEYLVRGSLTVTTLTLQTGLGIRLIGPGPLPGTRIYYALDTDDKPHAGAVLFKGGDPTQPLLLLNGSVNCAIENLGFVGATPHRYRFSEEPDDEDPGIGKFRFDNADFASVTQIFISTKDQYQYLIDWWLNSLDVGDAPRITITKVGGSAVRMLDVTNVVTATDYRKVDVIPVYEEGDLFDDDPVTVDFIRTGASPQPFIFDDVTSGTPGSTKLYFNSGTLSSVTQISISNTSANAKTVSTWLKRLSNSQRLTIRQTDDPNYVHFNTNGAVESLSGYHRVPVVYVGSSGGFDKDAPLLVFEDRPGAIRDRAVALVREEPVGGACGRIFFQNCNFVDGVSGVELDTEENGNNCADNTFVHCNFTRCDAGIRMNSQQVVNNALLNCDFSSCLVGIDQARGGDLRVFGGAMSGADDGNVFCKIRGGGPNASTFVLSGIRLERFNGWPGLLDASYPPGSSFSGEINVLIDGFTDAFNGGYPGEWNSGTSYANGARARVGTAIYESKTGSGNLNKPPAISPTYWTWKGNYIRPIQLGIASNCTLRGAEVRGPIAHLDGGGNKASLRLDNCRMLYTASDLVTLGTNGYWKSFDCTDVDGLPILDAGNWPFTNVLAEGKPGGQTVSGGTGSGDNLVFAAGHTNNPTLTLRAIASQTSSLTRWADSSGTPLLQVDTDGAITTPQPFIDSPPTAGREIVIRPGKGSEGGAGLDADGGTGGNLLLNGGTGGDGYSAPLGGPASGGSGGSLNLQAGAGGAGAAGGSAGTPGEVVVNDSGLASNFRVEWDSGNALFVNGTNGRVGIGTTSPSTTLHVAGDVTSTSVNLPATSSDVGIKRSSEGILQVTDASSGLGSLLVGSSSNTRVSLTVKGISSPSADLTQWQDNAGTILLQVDKDGQIATPNSHGQRCTAGRARRYTRLPECAGHRSGQRRPYGVTTFVLG